jgi:hypothetical protein
LEPVEDGQAVIDLGGGKHYSGVTMSSVAQKLASKLDEWEPEVSREVESLVTEIIELTDLNALDLARSRRVEQEVLDLLDEPITR